MTTYVRGANPLWYFPDLVGEPLDDTYYAFFLTNTLPYIPQAVYHDSAGTTPWNNPIQFSPAGTLPIDMYFDASLVYRIEIRHGNSQADQLIWLVENYVPGEGDEPVPPSGITIATDNQISNPQFSEILFQEGSTLAENGVTDVTVEIAPGWEFVGVGTGNYSISRVSLPADENIPTNPPYALSVVLSGAWSSSYLRQRFNHNAGIWANNAVSASITARANDGAPYQLRATLVRDDGQTLPLIQDNLNNAYTTFPGSSSVEEATSSTDPADSWTDFRINLPATSQISLTSIQLVGQDVPAELEYDQDTLERQVDHLFHYYKPKLEYKPIPSMLIGWDFPVNPAQLGTAFTVSSNAAAAAGGYTWDQTICGRAGTNVTVARNAITGGFQFTTAGANTGFYMLQYLETLEAREILGNRLAVNISAWRTNAGGDCTVRVYLCRAPVATAFPTIPNIIGTVTTGGIFTPTAGSWALIPRGVLGTPSATLSVVSTNDELNDVEDFMFNGWEITEASQIADTNKFAIMVTFECPTTGTVVTVDSISVCAGDIATVPAPQTLDEVLRECQYYYEKSYDNASLPGAVTNLGSVLALQSDEFDNTATQHSWYRTPFTLEYKEVKRIAPGTAQLVLYSPSSATQNLVRFTVYNGASAAADGGGRVFSTSPAQANLASTQWTKSNLGTKRATLFNNVTTAVITETGSAASVADLIATLEYHYTIDCRIGII